MTITEQIHKRIDEEEELFNKILYGEITFIIQDGIVLRRKNIDTKNYDNIKIGGTD